MAKTVDMRLQSTDADAPARSAAAEQIKAVARRLFAEKGVDGVTVREIASAAGQKNHGAVGYYFGSKESLVREIIVEGAAAIDRRRNEQLDKLEADGGPRTVREVVEVLIQGALGESPREDDYICFITMLSMTHRDIMMDALENRWNSGYLRCLEHLRRLMPTGLTPAFINQRFVFMGAFLSSVLAMRQRALGDLSRAHPTWGSKQTLDHFGLTVTAMLEAPVPSDHDGPHVHGSHGDFSAVGMAV
jgi:AcrR family transcriptional regulator